MKLEIELDGPHNECLHFRPLARSLRGKFDLNRCCEPQARMMTTRFPKPIPGLKLGIDTDTAQGYLIDPLHDAEHAPTREQIEGMGLKIGKRRETFDSVHVSTWLFWMQRAVQGGWATLVEGKFPDKLADEPQKSFITKPQPDKRDALSEKLVGLLVATLPAEKRREVAALIGE